MRQHGLQGASKKYSVGVIPMSSSEEAVSKVSGNIIAEKARYTVMSHFNNNEGKNTVNPFKIRAQERKISASPDLLKL